MGDAEGLRKSDLFGVFMNMHVVTITNLLI